jgi:Zn ribbon nucleic-acid-binding protein
VSERQCPNCQSKDSHWYECNGFNLRHCRECGTQWQEDYPQGASVPYRSQPAEVLELPDSTGWWWCGFPPEKLIQVWERNGSFYLSCRTGGDPLPRSQYVRAVPPIVAKPKRDEDAEWLRSLKPGASIYLSTDYSEKLRRIADRLDQAKERG